MEIEEVLKSDDLYRYADWHKVWNSIPVHTSDSLHWRQQLNLVADDADHKKLEQQLVASEMRMCVPSLSVVVVCCCRCVLLFICFCLLLFVCDCLFAVVCCVFAFVLAVSVVALRGCRRHTYPRRLLCPLQFLSSIFDVVIILSSCVLLLLLPLLLPCLLRAATTRSA